MSVVSNIGGNRLYVPNHSNWSKHSNVSQYSNSEVILLHCYSYITSVNKKLIENVLSETTVTAKVIIAITLNFVITSAWMDEEGFDISRNGPVTGMPINILFQLKEGKKAEFHKPQRFSSLACHKVAIYYCWKKRKSINWD